MNIKTFLFYYIKKRGKGLLIYFSLILIFGVLFILYDLPTAAFWDGTFFTGFLLICLLLFDSYRSYQKLKQLKNLLRYQIIPNNLGAFLPLAASLEETLYQELITRLISEKAVLETQNAQDNQQLLDYFGLWVHQIKTPLAALDLLLQAGNNEPRQLRQELFKIDNYLNTMLQFLRHNLVNEDLVLEPVQLDLLVRQVIKKYATFFIQKDLTVEIVPFQKTIISDRKWLTFILEQIIFNAVKYTNKGKISIDFQQDQLLITDTGIGILPEDLPRIFEKGYTGYNGREHEKSSGLGLYMSHTIAEKLGITLTITSVFQKGTTVYLNFPQQNYTAE